MRSADETLYGLDVRSVMRKFGVPGCSVAVLDAGEIVEQRGFGVRSCVDASADSSAVTPHTLFQACSISKPVSVFGALRLVDAGKLDLDADVNDQLTTWTVPANGDWQPRVTLRHLAGHTAGLTTSGFPGYAAGSPLPTVEQVLSGVAPANSPGVRVDILPGVRFRYSGGGTTVIQLLLETVTGSKAPDLLRELVLSPLGMASSTFAQPLPPEYRERAAHGHRIDGTPIPGSWHTYPEQCAAGLWTTPADLLRFARGVQHAGNAGADALLSTDMADQMLRPHAPLAPGEKVNLVRARTGGFDAIGLGPFLGTSGDTTAWFGHSGGNAGYRCHLLANLRTGQGAAVMTNGDAGMAVVARAFAAIAAEYRWADRDLGFESEHAHDPIPPNELGGSAGAYVSDSGLRVELSDAHGAMVLTIGGQPPVRLVATSPTQLTAEALNLVVRLDAGSLQLKQAGGSIVCTRIRE